MELLKAEKCHSEYFVKIIVMSAPDLMECIFGVKFDQFLRFLYNKKGNIFCSDFFYICKDSHDKIVGGALIYDYWQYKETKLKTTLYTLYFLNIHILKNIYNITKANKLIKNLKEGELYISNLAILYENRGKGYGCELMQKIFEEAKKRNCNKIVLDVEKDNAPAIDLYRKIGFTPNPNRITLGSNNHRFELIKMEKRL